MSILITQKNILKTNKIILITNKKKLITIKNITWLQIWIYWWQIRINWLQISRIYWSQIEYIKVIDKNTLIPIDIDKYTDYKKRID